MEIETKQIFQQARSIAIESLRECYKDGKILASLRNFSDYWARDTFWSLLGVSAMGDFDVARTCLEYFLSFQCADGKIPRKIALDYNGLKYLTGKSVLRKIPRPIYTGNLPPFSSMDGNGLFVIAFADYFSRTNDKKFLQLNYHQVADAIGWYEKHLREGFVWEYGLGNWMDTIFKSGAVLYTNVIYAEALKRFAMIAQSIGETLDAEVYTQKYKKLVEKMRNEFWNGNFFDDELGKYDHFDTAGNALAVYFEIASAEQAATISKKLIELGKNSKLLPTVDPKYPWWKVNPVIRPFGMKDYQNGTSWMWIDLFASAALFKSGFEKEALEMFENICAVIVKNGAVHETYFSDGTPYEAAHWKSAVPFAWNSGVFLKIYDVFF